MATTNETRRIVIAGLTALLSLTMHLLDWYDKHWWWDNASHFSAGVSLGRILPGNSREKVVEFIAIALVWEVYEYLIEMPRSMGDDDWSWDHRVEDTVLDVVMGTLGVIVSNRFR